MSDNKKEYTNTADSSFFCEGFVGLPREKETTRSKAATTRWHRRYPRTTTYVSAPPPKPRRMPISIHVHTGPHAAQKCRENYIRAQFLIRTTTMEPSLKTDIFAKDKTTTEQKKNLREERVDRTGDECITTRNKLLLVRCVHNSNKQNKRMQNNSRSS